MNDLLGQLKKELPVEINENLYLSVEGLVPGMIIVDEVNGFCTPGMGNLAPMAFDQVIHDMVTNTSTLAESFSKKDLPILSIQDAHEPDKPEGKFPPHCVIGTGEEDLVDRLKWLREYKNFTEWQKDCLNGFIGAIYEGGNVLLNWLNGKKITDVVIAGICTDICVMQLVNSLLSAINSRKVDLPHLKRVIVYTEACATYDFPLSLVKELDLPDTAAHPRNHTHYMGLYFMGKSGAILAQNVVL